MPPERGWKLRISDLGLNDRGKVIILWTSTIAGIKKGLSASCTDKPF